MADDIRTCGDLDERLTPYVDGEDPPDARAATAGHLHACPACAEQARTEAAARQMVRDHREALCAHAPASLRARCAQSAAGADRSAAAGSLPASRSLLRRWAPLSLAATLVLAVAGVFVFGLNDRVQALAASLAADHVKCFKVNGTATDADAHASERAWQADQGWPIVVPQTDAGRQLKLVGVRRCLSSDGRVAHLMYTWDGEPLSVYVLQADAGRDEIAHKMGAQEIIWRANRRTYAVVSGDTSRDLTSIVDYLKVRVQ
jgi:anti-sigma factor RsiW